MTTASRVSLKIDMKATLEHTTTTIPRTSTRKRRYQPPSPEYENSYSHSEEEEYDDDDSYDEETSDDCKYRRKPERKLMRAWLIEQVEKGDVPGLEWMNDDKTLIKIPWTHASRHGWEVGRDSSLFKLWAEHTGKYKADDNGPDSGPKKWKANFRCAMNSLPDVAEEKKKSCKKGHNAFKVYKLLPEKKRGGTVQQSKKVRTSSESETEQHYKRYTTNADRLEKTKLLKQLKKKIVARQQSPEQDQRVPGNFSIPKPTYTRSPEAYYSASDEEDRKPIVTSIPKCAEASWYNSHDDKYGLDDGLADRIEEVTTTPVTVSLHDSKVEHSYAKSNKIPSFVEQEDATSDYNSNSGSDQDVEDIVQEIVDLENNSPPAYVYTDQKFFPEHPSYHGFYNNDMQFKRSDSIDFNLNNTLLTMYNTTSFTATVPQYTHSNIQNSQACTSLLQELECLPQSLQNDLTPQSREVPFNYY